MEAQRRVAGLPYLHIEGAPAAFVRPRSLRRQRNVLGQTHVRRKSQDHARQLMHPGLVQDRGQ